MVGTLGEESPRVEYINTMTTEEVDEVQLLLDQQHAFDMVRDQVAKQNRNQAEAPIKLLVLGECGTGKSKLINRLHHLLQKEVTLLDGTQKQVSTASFSAFTGIAVSWIGGLTIHKEWSIQV